MRRPSSIQPDPTPPGLPFALVCRLFSIGGASKPNRFPPHRGITGWTLRARTARFVPYAVAGNRRPRIEGEVCRSLVPPPFTGD